MQPVSIDWKYQGCLADKLMNDQHGTYIFIYNKGPHRRIFYVGTATGSIDTFATRWKTERDLYLGGRFTWWRIPEDEDIYDYMSCGIKTGNNMRNYYREQANRNPPIMWGSSADVQPRVNDLNNSDIWNAKWAADACEFVKRLEVWACVLPDRETSLILETQLIYTLKTHYLIGYTDFNRFNSYNSSLLGQQSRKLEDVKGLEFEFKSFPDCDQHTLAVLRGMKTQ
jgi:hypothetical protein